MKGLEDVRFEPIKDDDAHEMPQIPSLTATSAFDPSSSAPERTDRRAFGSRRLWLPPRLEG